MSYFKCQTIFMNCCDQGNLGWAGWPQGMPGALLEVGAFSLIRRIQRFRFLKSRYDEEVYSPGSFHNSGKAGNNDIAPYVGIGYLHDQKSDKGKKSATWTPDFPKDGKYEVRVSHCDNLRRSTTTPVTILHTAGTTTIRINQQNVPKHRKLFRSLGVFEFKKGKTGSVTISNEGTEGKYVIVDAVQFLADPAKGDAPKR